MSWRQLISTLCIGLIGSFMFVSIKLPLPWLLGALFTTVCAALLGQKLWIPNWLRVPSLMTLGALFGTSVSPDFVHNFINWLPSMIAVTAYVLLVMPPIIIYLTKVAKLDLITAYFSAAPGGLLPMTYLGNEMGADSKTVSLIQSSRIVITVLIVPISFMLFAGYEPSGKVGSGGSFSALSLKDGLILLSTSLLGFASLKPLRVPTPALIGPMIAVAFISLVDINSAEIPDSLVAGAQCIIGSAIGAMFNGVEPRSVARMLFHGSLTSICMVLFATFAAIVTFYITGIETRALILAFAPGGFAEMALVGFALGVEVAFVISHQLTRYFFVILILPIMYKLIIKRDRG